MLFLSRNSPCHCITWIQVVFIGSEWFRIEPSVLLSPSDPVNTTAFISKIFPIRKWCFLRCQPHKSHLVQLVAFKTVQRPSQLLYTSYLEYVMPHYAAIQGGLPPRMACTAAKRGHSNRPVCKPWAPTAPDETILADNLQQQVTSGPRERPVSYTHLTLPTICSV